MLRKLKEDQVSEGYVDWQKIAQQLNESFSKSGRTSKQCREKYINYLKFGENVSINLDWTPEEIQLLRKMY